MKKNLLILLLTLTSYATMAQNFSLCPLDMNGQNAMPVNYSAPDNNHLWISMQGNNNGTFCNSKLVAHTNDEGLTFMMSTIPDSADRGGICMSGLDDQLAYAALTDINGINGGAIWKTTDGGISWTKKTTNEFAGGYLDYMHFFTPDSGVAFGDPNGGYFEIYTTTDGGNSWTRVPQSNVPANLAGEWGNSGNSSFDFSKNSIWCPTNKSRIYYSNDRGYTWNVSLVNNTAGYSYINMNDDANGVCWILNSGSIIYLTDDGGISWAPIQVPQLVAPDRISGVPNTYGTYVYKSIFDGMFVTTDNFVTSQLICSTTNPLQFAANALLMVDGSLGWSDVGYSHEDSALMKMQDIMTGIQDNNLSGISPLNIFPNPVETGYAMVSYSLTKSDEVTVTLFDLTGKEINHQAERGRAGNNAMVYNFNNVQSGLYLLQVNSGNQTSITKVIIK